ncbi:MAG TPA: hypothetical protein VHC22_32370 [Pirellulales bacterium]|nr:hypothetical protein [Pirellulales bacterium]
MNTIIERHYAHSDEAETRRRAGRAEGYENGTAKRTTALTPRQYNFARNWKSKIRPHLDDPDVVTALVLGMKLCDVFYEEGDPPWLSGRGPLNGQRAREGCLSWYQPLGCCHYIAPFCWAVGRKLFPYLRWGFFSGKFHTAVIGDSNDWERPDWVMDILLFRRMSAQQSLDFAKNQEWKFYDSFPGYLASFCSDPEAGLRAIGEMVTRDKTGRFACMDSSSGCSAA